MQAVWALLRQTYDEWSEDRVPRHAAALAYYTAFSLAPLLVVLIAIAGAVFGTEAVRGQLDDQLRGLLGADAARAVQDMVQSAALHSTSSVFATALSVTALLFGATGVFAELQDSLNTIWEVTPKPGRGWRGILYDRILSFGMVLTIAFLLMVSLVVSAGVAAAGQFVRGYLGDLAVVWHLLDIVVSIGVLTLLFGALMKWLPDAHIAWRHIWIGAATTSVLFTLGKTLLGLYLGRSSTTSVFGAAGSLVLILLWVYYSAQIFFFGAELTQVYAARSGAVAAPTSNAEPVTEEAREQQGIPHRGQRPPAASAVGDAARS